MKVYIYTAIYKHLFHTMFIYINIYITRDVATRDVATRDPPRPPLSFLPHTLSTDYTILQIMCIYINISFTLIEVSFIYIQLSFKYIWRCLSTIYSTFFQIYMKVSFTYIKATCKRALCICKRCLYMKVQCKLNEAEVEVCNKKNRNISKCEALWSTLCVLF